MRAHRGNLRMWRPGELAGVTLFRAEHMQQTFARHSHEEYAVGVITNGVLGFDYRGEHLLAGSGEVNLTVPGEIHTGHPALGEDWSYRMFYLQPAVLRDIARQLGHQVDLPFFRRGVIQDERLASMIGTLHADLDAHALSGLEAQSRLVALLATWINRHGEKYRASTRPSPHAPNVARVRDFLDECWREKPALNCLADMAGLSPYQLLRAFVRQYGLPPHAYLIQRQVTEARRLLDRGLPLTEVAFDCQFADQSHLHRHFKRIWGITPGQYRNFVQENRPAHH